jgi:hypothetical protein
MGSVANRVMPDFIKTLPTMATSALFLEESFLRPEWNGNYRDRNKPEQEILDFEIDRSLSRQLGPLQCSRGEKSILTEFFLFEGLSNCVEDKDKLTWCGDSP